MTGLEHAILGLRASPRTRPRRHHVWRWLVRHRMAGGAGRPDRRAAARRRRLAGRPGAQPAARARRRCCAGSPTLGPQVLEAPDVEPVRGDLRRLVGDLERHRQRLNDLVYDSVSLELGGSE